MLSWNFSLGFTLSCGKVYAGQTGRCLHTCLWEHYSSLVGRPFTHLTRTARRVDANPFEMATIILFRHHGKTQTEIAEAFHISLEGSRCTSHPLISLQETEIAFIQ